MKKRIGLQVDSAAMDAWAVLAEQDGLTRTQWLEAAIWKATGGEVLSSSDAGGDKPVSRSKPKERLKQALAAREPDAPVLVKGPVEVDLSVPAIRNALLLSSVQAPPYVKTAAPPSEDWRKRRADLVARGGLAKPKDLGRKS